MSEKRVYAASRAFAPFFGTFDGRNRRPSCPNATNPLRTALLWANSTRHRRTHSAKGAFTLSIDRLKSTGLGRLGESLRAMVPNKAIGARGQNLLAKGPLAAEDGSLARGYGRKRQRYAEAPRVKQGGKSSLRELG